MNNLVAQLIANGPVITDGAWATELQALGLPIGECPDAWNVTHPNSVAQVAASYVAAGSRVILTNTFGANRIALARSGAEFIAAQINREGVRISKLPAGNTALVFGSMGPCGLISSDGDLNKHEIKCAFEEQAAILAQSGVDALVLETMFRLDEALIALRAAKTTGLPVVACMTYTGGSLLPVLTWTGDTIENAIAALMDAGADAVGANCGDGAQNMVPICAGIKAACSLPIWMKPNAGLPEMVDGAAVYRVSPQSFAADAVDLIDAGADFIGGCCGTGPEHIRELARRIGGR